LRKDLVPSERAAIVLTMTRKSLGRPKKTGPLRPGFDDTAHAAGFSSRNEAKRTIKVVRDGTPEIIQAMDQGEISIPAAAEKDAPRQGVTSSLVAPSPGSTMIAVASASRLCSEAGLRRGFGPSAENVRQRGSEAISGSVLIWGIIAFT